MTRPLSRRAFARLLLAGVAIPGPLFAQQAAPPPIISDWPRRQPVFAQKGMVASQEEHATRVGVDILKAGGNAVDAAVAVGFALAVTLPRAGNLGGGGFMIVHRADRNETKAIDYRETAPASATKDMYLNDKGEADLARSQNSGLGVGVPGTVAGMALAHQRYGSGRFTLAELIRPAIGLARAGIEVGDDLAFSLAQSSPRLGRYESTRAIFYGADGRPLPRGARLQQPELAASLELIARDGPKGFYEGDLAAKLVAGVNAAGGKWTAEDLKAYRVVEREVVRGTYREHEIVSMPPPSSGGVHLVQILNILEGWNLKDMGQESADAIHLFAEASKFAYADRSEYLGDPDFVKVPVKALISKRYAADLRGRISAEKAAPAKDIRPGVLAPYESDQTTHYSVMDGNGNVVSNTYTLNFSYGLARVAEGTGILLNNELDDFAAKPGVPNAYGLVGGDANAPGPGKRPLSSMSPAIVFKDGRPLLVTGSPGGSRIITTVLQVISNVIDHGMNIAEATEAPRVHHQWLRDELRVERGLSPDTLKLLQARGHRIRVMQAMGSTHSILKTERGFEGASDLRQAGTLTAGW